MKAPKPFITVQSALISLACFWFAISPNAMANLIVAGGQINLQTGTSTTIDFSWENTTGSPVTATALNFNGQLSLASPVTVTALDVDGTGTLFDDDSLFGAPFISGGGTLWESSVGDIGTGNLVPADATVVVGRVTFDVPAATAPGSYGTLQVTHPIAGNSLLGFDVASNQSFSNSFNIAVVPEPSHGLYLTLATLAIAMRRKRVC